VIIKRDERILDARYLSREGDTGTRWWSAMRGRNRLSVFNGSVVSSEVVLGGRPGQLVFSFGSSAYKSGDQLPQPFEVATLFLLKTQGVSPDYPTPISFHPTTMVIGPYPYTVAVRSGLLLTTLAPAAGDDYIAFDGVPYVVGPPSTAIPNNTLVRTLTAGQTLTVQVQNTNNPFCNGEGYFTLYPQ
jgi:hypothetical protein